jgi:exopolysaccharide biosynthesis protein
VAEKIPLGIRFPINKAFKEVNKIIDEVNNFQTQINQMVVEGDSSVEAAQARVDANGNTYGTLKERLDVEFEEKAPKSAVLDDNAYYHEISSEKNRDSVSGTDYYISTINHLDKYGNAIQLKRGFAQDIPNSGSAETARSFANRHNATLTLNASVHDPNTFTMLGTDIYNGQILTENLTRSYYTLGIRSDNTLVAYPPGTTAQSIIDDGCDNALSAFIPLVQSGAAVSQAILDTYSGGVERHPRQVIAQFSNKDILILTCEGRTQENAGMTSDDLIRILLEQGVDFAYMLDGGGSAQTVVRGSTTNTSVFVEEEEEQGHLVFGERKVVDFLYISKSIKSSRDNDIVNLNKDLGDVNSKANKLRHDLKNKTDMNNGFIRLKAPAGFKFQGIEIWEGTLRKAKLQLEENRIGYFDYINGKTILDIANTGDITTSKGTLGNYNKYSTVVTDANNINENGKYWITSGGANTPDPTLSWDLDHKQLNSQSAIQEVTSFTSPVQKKARRKISGVWEAWG